MPWVLPTALEFPDLYEDFIGFFSFLNIGLLPRFVRLECEVRVDHYGKVVTMTLAPLVITSIGLLVSLVHQSRVADKAHLRAWYFGWFLVFWLLFGILVTFWYFGQFCCFWTVLMFLYIFDVFGHFGHFGHFWTVLIFLNNFDVFVYF